HPGGPAQTAGAGRRARGPGAGPGGRAVSQTDGADSTSGPTPAGPAEPKRPLLGLLLADQRQRWRGGDPGPGGAYPEGHPELGADTAVILDLIYQEILLRQERGEAPQAEEYQRRFPQWAEELALQLAVDRALQPEPHGCTGPGLSTPDGGAAGLASPAWPAVL